MVNSGVVAAIHVLGMRCDPCAVHHKGHNAYVIHVLLPQRRSWPSGFWIQCFKF